jgi:hypothetical protein
MKYIPCDIAIILLELLAAAVLVVVVVVLLVVVLVARIEKTKTLSSQNGNY